jgi:hypothetical protein
MWGSFLVILWARDSIAPHIMADAPASKSAALMPRFQERVKEMYFV